MNNILAFPNRNPVKQIFAPRTAKKTDALAEYTVSGYSLQHLGICDGDLLTCKTNFKIAEIKPLSVCVLSIDGLRLPLQCIIDESGLLITYFRKGKPITKYISEIEILALALEHRRAI